MKDDKTRPELASIKVRQVATYCISKFPFFEEGRFLQNNDWLFFLFSIYVFLLIHFFTALLCILGSPTTARGLPPLPVVFCPMSLPWAENPFHCTRTKVDPHVRAKLTTGTRIPQIFGLQKTEIQP